MSLQCAAKYGHVKIVDYLVERGVDIDHCDTVGYSSKPKEIILNTLIL